ncbi:tetratricopeptide repeat protein [Geoalkalibacter halelectricus]|uniref:Tetratricopeptide repeat protein n=1 Tax=Geoalkalibacter halelectricus TaxID=2847045 RepID=A0ABY5ZV07_9BACT|nr:tetratricopeptide repeat protein [Geoalkalibacter halelectricus]MDO3377681.1 tetratricopeptide repeat protein [Geoalkalibacter halelectricus]UWZ81469.1 tetratricopeptide repeat protein [Geoalkalibacter halelectricus]
MAMFFRFFPNPRRRAALALVAVLLALVLAVPAAGAGPTVSARAHEALSKAQNLLQEGQWRPAEEALAEIVARFADEPYALAIAWQMRGYLRSEMDQPREALRAYERVLELAGDDAAMRQQARYNSAQLLMTLERYAEAIAHIDAWVGAAAEISPAQRVQAAWIYFGAQAYEQAALHLEQALQETSAPPESWYQMLLATYQNAGNHAALKRWLPRVIAAHPNNKNYWQLLSSTYLHEQEDRRAVATLAAAYHNGLLTESQDLLHMARLFLYAGVPHKAARTLQEALDQEHLATSAANLELLADAWMQAREAAAAVSALEKALAAGGDAAARLKLGRLLVQEERWGEAIAHLQRAAAAAEERTRGEALLLLGMAAYHEGRPGEARSAFTQAREHAGVRRQADNWLAYLAQSEEATGS